jgi:hypothetical protein
VVALNSFDASKVHEFSGLVRQPSVETFWDAISWPAVFVRVCADGSMCVIIISFCGDGF